MRSSLIQALLDRRTEIRARWMELLLVEPVASPLANPRTMIFMLDGTLDAVFAALRRGQIPLRVELPECPCGHNPYLAYFRAGTQALHEALILLQAGDPKLVPTERDAAFAELDTTIRGIARREIETFAALCQHPERGQPLAEVVVPFPGEGVR
jgi:hypothetical protein